MPNHSMFNADTFNGSGWTNPDIKTYSPDQPYILHIMDINGVFLRKVEGFTGGAWDTKINKPEKLNFDIPVDSATAQSGDIKSPNRVFLYDSTFTLLGRFVIVKTSTNVSPGEANISVECADYLYLLDQEYAPLSGVAGSTGKFDSQVEYLLAFQVNANPITIGYIAPIYANQDFVYGLSADKSIYKSLIFLWKQIGGVVSVDPQGRLRWDTDGVSTAKHTLSLYDDIAEYSVDIDSDRVVNRIYSKRNNIHDDGTSHLRLAYPNPGYIEDTASQAIYGIRSKNMSFNTEDATELSTLMARTLATMKEPKITRKISAIDLNKIQFDPDETITPHPKYIFTGAKVKVAPPSNVPNDTTFKGMITSVKRDLADFLNVEITVADETAISSRTGAGGLSGATNEFFDILAEGVQDDYYGDPNEWESILFDQDELIWNTLDTIDPTSTTDADVQPVGAANDAGGTATGVSPIDHVHLGIIMVEFDGAHTAVSDLGTPAGMAMGYLDDSAGINEGMWFFPADGSTNADWKRVNQDSLIYDASWTQQSDLGNPQAYARGYLDSGAGTDAGFWVYPPDGTTNADWVPESSYN